MRPLQERCLRTQFLWFLVCGDLEEVVTGGSGSVMSGTEQQRGAELEVKQGRVLGAKEPASGGSADVSSPSLQKF